MDARQSLRAATEITPEDFAGNGGSDTASTARIEGLAPARPETPISAFTFVWGVRFQIRVSESANP